MKTVASFLLFVCVVICGYTAVSAAGVAAAPAPITIWVSGASSAVTPAAGWQCWGDAIGTYQGPVVVRFNVRPATAVTIRYGGCAAEGSITLAARDAWARATYPDKVWKSPVVWGQALPTATRTATAVPPTKTATRTVPPTATRTATKTATAVPTATPLPMLRADVTHSSGVFKPQLGWVVWCKSYGSYTNVVMKITTAPFYGVVAADCGAQTKAPFNTLAGIKSFLEAETAQVWTVK